MRGRGREQGAVEHRKGKSTPATLTALSPLRSVVHLDPAQWLPRLNSVRSPIAFQELKPPGDSERQCWPVRLQRFSTRGS